MFIAIRGEGACVEEGGAQSCLTIPNDKATPVLGNRDRYDLHFNGLALASGNKEIVIHTNITAAPTNVMTLR